MKTSISYLMFEMDFCELFDWVKKQAKEMTDLTAFKTILRPRRRNKDCEIKSGEPMTTYFKGYNLVNDMDNAIYEIDIYESGLFMRIARRLGEVIIDNIQ